jgi:hypothetical protein
MDASLSELLFFTSDFRIDKQVMQTFLRNSWDISFRHIHFSWRLASTNPAQANQALRLPV